MVDDASFNFCPFWVHLLGIPIGLSTEKVAMILATKESLVLEVERRNRRFGFGNEMKVRVCVDISKPLKRVAG